MFHETFDLNLNRVQRSIQSNNVENMTTKKKGSVLMDCSEEKYQQTISEMCRLLSIGMKTGEVSKHLKMKGYNHCSVSALEKFIRYLKDLHKAKTLVHLFMILKKKGII